MGSTDSCKIEKLGTRCFAEVDIRNLDAKIRTYFYEKV